MTPESRTSSRYDQGYARGWSDIHESTKQRRKRTRTRPGWEEYAVGYDHGRIDGASHPYCPQWDQVHRAGSLHDLSTACPWNPETASRTPDWSAIDGNLPRAVSEAIGIRREALTTVGSTRAAGRPTPEPTPDTPTPEPDALSLWQRGQLIVEAAILFPVLLLALLGSLELGMSMLHAQVAQNAAATIAARPDILEVELDRLSMDCVATITEADGIRLVRLDCDNPWPLLGGYVSRSLTGEATAAILESPAP